MNIIPIKVENALPANHNYIEWMLHNVCNYNCSFCGDDIKNGSDRWLTLDQYKKYADEILSKTNSSPTWVNITGGEPTLFPYLIELLTYIKRDNVYVSLISNGTRTIRWWNELKEQKCVDILTITYHSEQTSDYKHAAAVLNLFHDEKVKTICNITHAGESIDLAIEARKYLEENTGAILLFKAIINNKEVEYTPTQLEEIKKSWFYGMKYYTKTSYSYPPEIRISGGLKFTYNDNSTKIVEIEDAVKNKQTNFFGWNCYVGFTTMRIVKDKIYRGVCQEGGIHTVLGQTPVQFVDTPIKCNRLQCNCATDLLTTKIK